MHFRRYFVVLKPDNREYALNGKPEGFIRVERTESKGRMMINISGLKPPKDFSYQGILMGVKDGKSVLIKMGELKVDERGRNLSQWLFDPENIAETGLKLDNIKVYAVAVDSLDNDTVNTPLVGGDDELPDSWKEDITSQMRTDTATQKEEPYIDMAKPEKDSGQTKEENRSFEDKPKQQDKEPPVHEAEKEDSMSNANRTLPDSGTDKNIEDTSPDIVEENNKTGAEDLESDNAEIISNEAPAAEERRGRRLRSNKEEDKETDKEKAGENTQTGPDNPAEEPKTGDDEVFEFADTGNAENENYITGLKEYIKNITRHLDTVEPFDEEDMKNYKWWKLETGSGLTKSHYLMGLSYNEDNKVKYIVYAMPGRFNRMEQPYSGMTGFVSFKPLKGQILQYNADGYWIMHIDALTGSITTPLKLTPPPLFDSDFL